MPCDWASQAFDKHGDPATIRAVGTTTRLQGGATWIWAEGKVALVTGGSKGIGRACAARLAAEGCDVMIVARTEADLQGAAEAIANDSGRRVEICATDLRSPQGCQAAVGALKHAFGRFDILVNNAGATQSGDFFKLDDAVWEDGFALKFYACVRLSRALWPVLKDAQGAVVNVVGGASKTPSANFMIGGAVNAAITNFTKALAELGLRDGVTVNAVHPGMTVTGRLDSLLNQRAAADGLSRDDVREAGAVPHRAAPLRPARGRRQPGHLPGLAARRARPWRRPVRRRRRHQDHPLRRMKEPAMKRRAGHLRRSADGRPILREIAEADLPPLSASRSRRRAPRSRRAIAPGTRTRPSSPA